MSALSKTLQDIIEGLSIARRENEANQMVRQKHEIDMRKGGFTQQQPQPQAGGGGLAGLFKTLTGGGQQGGQAPGSPGAQTGGMTTQFDPNLGKYVPVPIQNTQTGQPQNMPMNQAPQQQPQPQAGGGGLGGLLKSLVGGGGKNYQYTGQPVSAKEQSEIDKNKQVGNWYERRDTGKNKNMTASEYNAAIKAAGSLHSPGKINEFFGVESKKAKELKKKISKQYLEQAGLTSIEDKIQNGGFETIDEVVKYLRDEEGWSEDEASNWASENVEE